MSRIQEILNKAERDGTARRTRSLGDAPPAAVTSAAHAPAHTTFETTAPWTPTATARALEEPPPATAPTVTLDPRLVAAIAPQSLAAEQYRSLRTRVAREEAGRTIRSILITSPAKGDGKSLTAANLALTMAQEFQQRVLLLDGDLRRPSVSRLFGLSEGPGLSDVLMGAVDLDAALIHLPDQHLTILPAGTPPHQPAELLGSTSMRRVLDVLRTRFDRILIDMPPVAPLADVHVLAPLADGVLMIVRAGVTPKPAIERALSGIEVAKVLGLVLNDAGEGTGESYRGDSGYGYIGG